MLDLPGSGAHLEFTATEHTPPPAPHAEALLVLYLGNQSTVDRVLTRLAVTPVPCANPYWDRVGVTVVDPPRRLSGRAGEPDMAAISAILITCSGSRVVADASKNCTLKGKDNHDHPRPKRPSRCAGW
jgi:hypothetical protein